MQGNVNIPDSTITTNLSFRQLVLMNMQQLTNFPYIEKDFDALTDYELLCLVVKFLNDVIANQNEQNDSITRMYESFLALQDYVNNTKDTLEDAFNELDNYVRDYFANLDVQDEINNKLDEYLEDGTLQNLINQYLNTVIVDVRNYGARGDGTTDDTTAIQNAIDGAITNNIKTIVFPTGSYVVSNPLTISDSNLILKGLADAELKYVGDGTSGNIIEIKGTNADNYVENITISGLKIDGTSQIYKGGYSMDTPTITHTNPAYRGLVCIWIEYAKNVKVRDNIMNDVYGEGVRLSRCCDVEISNNKLYNVSSGNIQYDGQTGYDNHGDGIAAFFSYNIIFKNNTIINKRTYLDGMTNAIGKPCGRSGLEFEYAINGDYTDDNPDDNIHNAPDYENIPTIFDGDKDYRYGFGLYMVENYVYGYTKGVHIESKIKTIIKDNTIVFNHIAIMDSSPSEQIITGNYVNPFKVGPAPQGGYDRYYGAISISEYGDTSSRYGTIVNNNILDGDGRGIVIGTNNVNIVNNTFKSKYNIYLVISNLKNIVINANTFNNTNVEDFNSFLYVYNTQGCNITNNTFYSTTPINNTISGNNITISNNRFFNTSLNNNNGGNNIIVENNLFDYDSYNSVCLTLSNTVNSKIENNTIYGNKHSTANDNYLVKINGRTEKTSIKENVFYINKDRTLAVFRNENVIDSFIVNNYLYNNGVVDFILAYNTINSIITDNIVEDTSANYYHTTGSFQKFTVVERNRGQLQSNGPKPNDSIGRFNETFFELSQRIYRYNINSSSTNIGWICVSAGWYVTTSWTSGNSYNVNTLIKNSNDNIYKCITKGSGNSTVEPTHTTTANVTETDGYEWEYLGSIAVLKDLPL